MTNEKSPTTGATVTGLIPNGNEMSKDNNYLVRNQDNLIPPPDFNLNGSPDALAAFEHLRITDTTPIPNPEPIIKISGETIATADDIFTISGASKSGKSAFVSMLIGAAISETGQISDGLEGVEVLFNADKKAVIHFDTEQARHKHQRNLKTILKRADFGNCPDFYLSYNIRQLDIDEYAEKTTGICQAASDKFNGIHSIWIDGGADYIADVNDPEGSNAAVKYFEELAIQYHTAVFIIVHTNPGSDKERGHFGSQCQRKSGGIIMVKSEGDISFIEPKILRYAGKNDIPQLMFKFDKAKGYHVGCGVKSEESTEAAKFHKRIAKAWELCLQVFGGQRSHKYSKAVDQIMQITGKSEAPAKGMFKDMKAHEMIIQGTDEHWRINQKYEPV
ncbi:hypothetical protein SDC9_21028 [bioreactor metagenome]|jgi:hypothetical protein|uniref:AAA domain-containing protein n=1 Tax=bioreactor metagenome TaxID=1076179 RepID=A0A644U8C7_9ZZZZ|nr:hypothetical protein [Lentimicrobium sp.]MEA5109914.1 hypothetical protein [Lentimicrobium sp.]